MKVIVIVDMQNDFITGTLGSKEAQVARNNLCAWIQENVSGSDKVIFTQDTHLQDYFSKQEGKKLPISHCMRGSKGWLIDEKIMDIVHKSDFLISMAEKPTFGIDLTRYMPFYLEQIEEIIFCGVCTDICVISNALILKAALPEIPMKVIAKCCAGLTPEKHEAALSVMESCQIEVVRD